jgi:hypothetical protein
MSSLDRLHVCPTSLIKLGRNHVKKFLTNIYFVQHRGENGPHQPGYHGLASWFHITIEPDAYCEYSYLVRTVSPQFVFEMIYVTLIVSRNGPGDVSSRPLLPELFWCHFLTPNFLAERHTKIGIHSISLSFSLSPLRQQPYLKAQTTEQ